MPRRCTTRGLAEAAPALVARAGEFALFSDDGDVHSEQDVRDWLSATGWAPAPRRTLAGRQRLITALAP